MSTFPSLVRGASPNGEDRYFLGDPLVDRPPDISAPGANGCNIRTFEEAATLPSIPRPGGVGTHVVHQPAELSSHLLGVGVTPLAVAGQHPREPGHPGQSGHRLSERLPRVPSSWPEHVETVSLLIP